MRVQTRHGFWREAFALQGSIKSRVLWLVLAFGLIATGVWGVGWLIEKLFDVRFALEITPSELAGAALGVILVFRTEG
jgi:predicted membrane chloride channel (bestrophin family)